MDTVKIKPNGLFNYCSIQVSKPEYLEPDPKDPDPPGTQYFVTLSQYYLHSKTEKKPADSNGQERTSYDTKGETEGSVDTKGKTEGCDYTKGETEVSDDTKGKTEGCDYTKGKTEGSDDTKGKPEGCDYTKGKTEVSDGANVQKRGYNEEGATGNSNKQEGVTDNGNKQEGVTDNGNKQEGVTRNTNNEEVATGDANKQEGATSDAGSKENSSKSWFYTRVFSKKDEDNKALDENPKSQEKTSYDRLKRMANKWMKPLHFNWQGIKKSLEENYTEALDWFQQAAAADDTNTNALRHCRVIYSKLDMSEKVEEMNQQIEALSTGEHAQVSSARSVAEVAVAGMVHPMFHCYKPSCYQMLRYAIETAGNGVSEMEKAFWKVTTIQAIEENPNLKEIGIEKSINRHRYEGLAELACGDFAEITAYALAQMGIALQRPCGMELKLLIEGIIQEQHILGGSLEPGDYLHAAYKLDPTSPSVCLRYTWYLTRSNQLSKAKDMMKKTFSSLAKDEKYVAAHAASGELLVKLYREEEQRKEYLIQAVQDLRFAARYTMSPLSMGQLASTFHYLLVHDNQISIDIDDMERCLAYFQKSTDLADGTPYTQTHLHHSLCLAAFGYIRKAVESSKRVIENDDLHKASTFFMYHLMKQFAKLYEEEGHPDFILSEMTFWMLFMCNKHAHLEDDMRRTLGNFYYHNKSTMVRMYHNLLHLGYHKIAGLFPRYIRNFSSWCRDRPIEFLVPPSLTFPYNQLDKVYDVVILHSVTDRPWVYYSLLTKLEMVHELKCCVIGRDIINQNAHDDVYEDEFSAGAFHSPGKDVQSYHPTAHRTILGSNENTPTKDDSLKSLEQPAEEDAGSNLHEDLTGSPKAKIGGNKTDPDPSLMAAVQNSICIILVISKNTLNSIWFRDGKPSLFLQQIMDSDQFRANKPCRKEKLESDGTRNDQKKVIALCMEKDLDCDEIFPGNDWIEEFDCSVLVPWEDVVDHIKICCGDTEQELRKFDVVADLKKDTLIGEGED